MGERIFDKPSVDRSQFPKTLMYIDTEGYICKANLGGGELSPEQVAKRKKRWDAVVVENKFNIEKRKKLRELIAGFKKRILKLAVRGDNVTDLQIKLNGYKDELKVLPRAKVIPARYK
jgi:hypothetical protein